jgi:hypothetical protein
MTAEPTDADRQRARELRQAIHQTLGWPLQDDLIAQALADERHRALAPVLALADVWNRSSEYRRAADLAAALRRATGQQP